MPNKTVLNTKVNKNQFVQRLQRTAGSCAEGGSFSQKIESTNPAQLS